MLLRGADSCSSDEHCCCCCAQGLTALGGAFGSGEGRGSVVHRVRFPLTSHVKEHYNRKPFEACSYCAPCCAPRYQGTGGVHILPKCVSLSLCPFAVYGLEHFLQVCICKRNMLYYAGPLVTLHSIDGITDVMGHLYQNILWDCCAHARMCLT